MTSSQQDLDKSFNDLKEMFPAIEAPRIWSAYLANKGDFDATLVSCNTQWILYLKSQIAASVNSTPTVQDQLLAMDVQHDQGAIGNRDSHDLDLSLEDRDGPNTPWRSPGPGPK